MKKLILALIPLFAFSTGMMAQDSAFEKILSNLYLPLEGGITIPSCSYINPGMMFRTSLEWRREARKGPYCAFHYDSSDHTYSGYTPESSNVSQGDAAFQGFYLGGGYRSMLSNHFSFAALLQAGMLDCTYTTVTPGMSGDYLSDHLDAWTPSFKTTVYLEYFIIDRLSLFLSLGYTKHLKQLPISNTPGNNGNTIVSIGLTAGM